MTLISAVNSPSSVHALNLRMEHRGLIMIMCTKFELCNVVVL